MKIAEQEIILERNYEIEVGEEVMHQIKLSELTVFPSILSGQMIKFYIKPRWSITTSQETYNFDDNYLNSCNMVMPGGMMVAINDIVCKKCQVYVKLGESIYEGIVYMYDGNEC